jgi:alpha-L-fucosidase 2
MNFTKVGFLPRLHKGKHLSLKLWTTIALVSLTFSSLAAPYSQRMGISYSYPTNYNDWEDAFLAGNGKMGIMVFGNPLNDTIIYNDRGFNMAANTNAPVRTFAQVSVADEMTIRSNCAAGNFAAADKLAVRSAHYHDGGEGNRHPGYEMLISIPQDGDVSNYSRICDFRTGVVSVNWTDNRGGWTRKSFVSRKDDVTVQYLTAPTKGKLACSIHLATNPQMRFPSSMRFTSLADAGYLDMRAKYPPDTDDAGYEGVTRVVTSGGTESVDGDVLTISNADSVLLLTRTAKYHSNCENQWNQELLQKQLAEIPANYETLLKGQTATHGDIYDRVKIDLDASAEDRAKSNEELLAMQKNSATPVKALWERVFDAGRYYFLSSSSSNTPPDLLGIWTGDCNAGWGGFYTLDANLNLQVAGGNIGDMPEAMAGYFTINEGWQRDFETNAARLLDCRGMLAAGNTPGTTSGLLSGINGFYPYQYATGEEGWVLYPFWEHYLITGDTNFLRNQLYPLLKDMGCFYEDFLTLTDTNGNYIFAGSVSPENQPSNVHVSLVDNSDFDISGTKFCLTALIQTCNILGLDQGAGRGVERWTTILKKLPPYLVGEPNNSIGALCEWSWPGLKDNFNHRHSSGLLPVWPYQQITPETTPALFKAALNTLTEKDKYNYENAGHGLLHSALIAANLKDAASVNAKLLRLTREGFYYDSLCSSHYNNHGVFCTDTCNAVPGIMMEMLVCSSPGVLEFLPALPPALTQGSISGVKGRNRVTIENLTWNMQNHSVSCTLRSDIDQKITLIERDGIESINVKTPTNWLRKLFHWRHGAGHGVAVGNSPLGEIAKVVQLQAGVSASIAIGLGNQSN